MVAGVERVDEDGVVLRRRAKRAPVQTDGGRRDVEAEELGEVAELRAGRVARLADHWFGGWRGDLELTQLDLIRAGADGHLPDADLVARRRKRPHVALRLAGEPGSDGVERGQGATAEAPLVAARRQHQSGVERRLLRDVRPRQP